MKALFFVASAVLAFLTPPALGQVVGPSFAGPMEARKVGDYEYVWQSTQISASKVSLIKATCPQGYTVVSGGYEGVIGPGYYGGFNLYASRPTQNFDGWLIAAVGTERNASTKMTVYATCAPPTK